MLIRKSDHNVTQDVSQHRREFLRKTVTAGSGLAAAAAAGKGLAAVTEFEQDAEVAATSAKKGYHLTQHIRDYYKTASF